jgi:cytochrome c5
MNGYRFLPLILVTLLSACGEEAPPPAAHTPAAPAAETTPAASAPAAAEAPAPAPAADAAAAAGEGIYKKTCVLCHSSGVGGAPIPGNAADWESRVATGKDTLYKHALEGYTGDKGMMPARGGNAKLTDDEVKAAVDYMLSKLN